MTAHRLAIVGEPPPDLLPAVRRAAPAVRLVDGGPADTVFAWSYDAGDLVRRLDTAGEPGWIHTRAVGLDPRLAAWLHGRATVLSNGRGGHGVAVAEHALALMLAHYHGLPALWAAQRRAEWRDPHAMTELGTRRVVVLGAGDVGASIARLLRALGATVVAVGRTPRPAGDVVGVDGLDAALAGADALVIAVPLTGATRGLVDRDRIRRLHPGALLVNVARGPVVDAAAMIAALRDGHLAGAALDVFDDEPLPAGSPLWGMPGVMVSPHCADNTAETDERCARRFLDNLRRRVDGRPLRGVVDPERGY